MTWFLRAVEQPNGHWQCRHGLLQIDTHPSLVAASVHLAEMAASLHSAECFAHYQDGRVEQL